MFVKVGLAFSASTLDGKETEPSKYEPNQNPNWTLPCKQVNRT